jgi:photosystem II stability/assembly factor-like uncharacterized protein
MYGENFSDKVSDVKLTFDGVVATIVSATATEIKFILPQTDKLIPNLVLTIENRTINNEVKNDYQGNIGILPKKSTSDWITIPYNANIEIGTIQVENDKLMYYSTNKDVYKTMDGGITFTRWATVFVPGGIFHATKNDEGWSSMGSEIEKVPVGGLGIKIGELIKPTNGAIFTSLYVDSNMKDGTVISGKGAVFTTTNGLDFTKIHEVSGDGSYIFRASTIDNNHIWAVGYKSKNSQEQNNGKYKPFILFRNDPTDYWKEYTFVEEPEGYSAREISFTDTQNGFILIGRNQSGTFLDVKLFKTTNGGNSWTQVYHGEKFTKFAFKDANIGWAILENKIYKTTNGGTTWTVDYTNDQPINGISYKNNIVWAISSNKILKRYL